MKKRILALALVLALPLSGCASLLERSYTVVEPYTDRYWDSAQEDTLRVESYQDLVNSLLLLVDQRAQEGVVRYEGTSGLQAYHLVMSARQEIMQETLLGSYLLQDIAVTYASGEDRSRFAFTLTYREEAEDPEKLMVLSDAQSLADLLRISLREGHTALAARFLEKTSQEEVAAVVDSLWRELQQEQTAAPQPTPEDTGEAPAADSPPDQPAGEGSAPQPSAAALAEEDIPPCPWSIRFYPRADAAEIVEILLEDS